MLAWIWDPWTIILVGLVALLLFGSRLPEVARSLGRSVNEFKKGLREVQDEVSRDEPLEPPREPRKLRPPADDAAVDPAQPGTSEEREPVARHSNSSGDDAKE